MKKTRSIIVGLALLLTTLPAYSNPLTVSPEHRAEMLQKTAEQKARTANKRYWISVGFLAAGTVLDFWSSAPEPGYAEVQPWMNVSRGGQAALIGTGSGIAFGVSWMLHKQKAGKAAQTINYIMGGIHGGAAVYNWTH